MGLPDPARLHLAYVVALCSEQSLEKNTMLQVVGNIAKVLIPVLLVGAGVVGVFAAKTYNEGAECAPTPSHLLVTYICVYPCLPRHIIRDAVVSLQPQDHVDVPSLNPLSGVQLVPGVPGS